jgi:hypothetical protein
MSIANNNNTEPEELEGHTILTKTQTKIALIKEDEYIVAYVATAKSRSVLGLFFS